jgi:hypothetical protein
MITSAGGGRDHFLEGAMGQQPVQLLMAELDRCKYGLAAMRIGHAC